MSIYTFPSCDLSIVETRLFSLINYRHFTKHLPFNLPFIIILLVRIRHRQLLWSPVRKGDPTKGCSPVDQDDGIYSCLVRSPFSFRCRTRSEVNEVKLESIYNRVPLVSLTRQ